MRYQIVTAASLEDLEKKVNQAMESEAHWEPIGGIAKGQPGGNQALADVWAQPMSCKGTAI